MMGNSTVGMLSYVDRANGANVDFNKQGGDDALS